MKAYIQAILMLLLIVSCKKELQQVPVKPPEKPSGLPKLITNPVTDLTRYFTKFTGAIIDTGDSKIIDAGFIIDTFPSPTLERKINQFTSAPGQNGLMEKSITGGIPGNTTFYLRSYAKNSRGIAYGNEIKFVTLSENIYKGNVILSTQQEVEEFGKGKYTTIDGDLEIRGTVSDLSPLKDLALINYQLRIINTAQLPTLKGLDSLEKVSAVINSFRGIIIENNIALKSLKGLERLSGNDGRLWIINNDELTDLNGLNNISFNNFGAIKIEGCEKLRNVNGLEKLEWIQFELYIRDNPALVDISSFRNLTEIINGRIHIERNASLQNVYGFEKLHTVVGVQIFDNNKLSDLNGFKNIDKFDLLFIRNNDALKDLSGFENVTTVSVLKIEDSPFLNSLKGLQNLKNVTSELQIRNTGLTNLAGLENLSEAKTFNLIDNEKLLSLEGISKLTKLHTLALTRSPLIKSLLGLNLINVESQLYFGFNRMLSDFCPLKTLYKTGWTGNFFAEGNAVNPKKTEVTTNCP